MRRAHWQTLPLLILLAAAAASFMGSPRPASAEGCDITSDSSCDSLASLVQLRADIASQVPFPWQRSFNARTDAVERRVDSLEAGDDMNSIFVVLMSYLKMVAAETRQDRENSRQGWRAEFLPTLTSDVGAVIADVCAIVECGEDTPE